MNAKQLPTMPPDLADLYPALWQQAVWLHIVWNQYRQLFGTSPQQLDLLNEMAPGFFRVCHDALLDDVVLTLCRLTDGPKSCGQPNMVLKRVADAVAACGEQALTVTVEIYLNEAVDRCETLREHRHKRLAHADLNVAVYKSPLGTITREMIENALESVRSFINAIGEHFHGSPTDFQTPGALLGEANALIYRFKEAKAYRKHQMAGRVNPFEDGIRLK